MSRQTSVAMGMAVALAGMVRELFRKTRSYINSTPQVETVEVDGANVATTATVNGTAVTVNSAEENKTTTELATMLAAAINAAALGVTATSSNAVVTVVDDVPGTGFTLAATTNLKSLTSVTPNTGDLPFGRFVSQNTSYGGQCHLPVAATDITSVKAAAGVAVRVDSIENESDQGYAIDDAVEVLAAGTVWVEVEDAVTPASDVYVRYTATEANPNLGSFRSDSDTSKAGALPTARWLTSAGAGELALLEINLP